MTAQVTDAVSYRGQDYSIAGINGKGLFDPAEHGMKPVGICTACWRGFVCAYRVEGQALILDKLSVDLAGSAPDLFGIRPNQFAAGVNYEDLSHKVPYTGGLRNRSQFSDSSFLVGPFRVA